MTKNRTIGSEAPLPKFVAKNDHMVASWLIFAGFEGATELWCDTEHLEVIGRDGRGTERLRMAYTRRKLGLRG